MDVYKPVGRKISVIDAGLILVTAHFIAAQLEAADIALNGQRHYG